MTRKSAWASLAMAAGLSLFSTACKDTKTLQENEQLKTQVTDLQKQLGEVGNNLETVTADRDNLKKENESLKSQLATHKKVKSKKRATSHKRHSA